MGVAPMSSQLCAQQELHKVPHENMHTSLCVCVYARACTRLCGSAQTHMCALGLEAEDSIRNFTATVHFIYQDDLSLNLELIN